MQNGAEHGKRITPGPYWITLTTDVELYFLLFGFSLQRIHYRSHSNCQIFRLPGEIDFSDNAYTKLSGTENQKFRHSQKPGEGLLCGFVQYILYVETIVVLNSLLSKLYFL